MIQDSTCPICLNRDGYKCQTAQFGSYDALIFYCDVCGEFVVSRTALIDVLNDKASRLTPVMRAVLSHRVRAQNRAARAEDMWTTDRLDSFFSNDHRLPSPGQQATNIISFIGRSITESGTDLKSMAPSLASDIGSPSAIFALKLLAELKTQGIVTAMIFYADDCPQARDIGLTLAGWELFEKERQGQISGSYGFVALKFGDPILDPLLKDHIKPAVRDIGYDLVDLRDVARAGIIDNLLRMQIRDAAFVLVDLTHENAGAYWEAGYAEGLGKPVLYLCERTKFDEKKTHFDTNHCTTVLWDNSDIDNFRAELQATIRRSLLS